MPSRIGTYVHSPKRPPGKRKAVALNVPAVTTVRSAGNGERPVPVEPEPADPPPATDDSPAGPAPPAAESAIVTALNRKRAKHLRMDVLSGDPEADAEIRAWLERAKWGWGTGRQE